MFYLTCKNIEQRTQIINYLKSKSILSVFHYLSLHRSPYYKSKYVGKELIQADKFSDCLVRLPFYFELSQEQQAYIIHEVTKSL